MKQKCVNTIEETKNGIKTEIYVTTFYDMICPKCFKLFKVLKQR